MVLSNYKCMLTQIQISRILFQQFQVHSKHVSSNRIKIQVILLILRLETDYFSSYSFQKCSIQSSGTTVFTETSRTAILHEEVPTGFFTSNSTRVPIHIQHTSIHRILHPESNSMCRRQRALRVLLLHTEGKETFIPEKKFYTKKAKRSSRSPSVHPTRPSKDIPGIPAARPSKGIPDIPDIPVIHDISASPGNSTSFSISRESTPFQHSPIRMHILHILQILQFDWFPQKTPPSTSWTIQTFNKHYILQSKGDVISVKIRIG